VGTESGIWQVHAVDLTTGSRRQVTDHPVGVTEAHVSADGERVVWFQDETGNESGRWWAESFDGAERAPFVAGLPHGWNEGISIRRGAVAAAISDRDGFALFVARDGEEPSELRRRRESIRIRSDLGPVGGGLSPDLSMVSIESGEGTDLLHPTMLVLDARSGDVLAERRSAGGSSLQLGPWSPVSGDPRIGVSHEPGDWIRPAIWSPATDGWRDLQLGDLPGEVALVDWWPDASAVLLLRTHEGRQDLFRYELETDSLSQLDVPRGHIPEVAVRPDGSVWFAFASGTQPERVLDDRGATVLAAEGDPPPPSRPYEDWWFDNGQGDRVHGFFVRPEGEGPFPVLMHPHGGPTWLNEDRWEPEIQAYVDAGFVVGMANYRGSTGYGRSWRERLVGDIGGPDLHDTIAGLDDLVARGLADPERAVVCGWSWGGYLTLLALGKHPGRWAAGVAGIPVGDYEAGYEELSPSLQAYDRALLGGKTPAERPDLMADRNPINHVDAVKAPVIFIVGEHDSRCPPVQALRYVERLAARRAPHEVIMFAAGHGSYDVDEEVRQQRAILGFLDRQVPGLAPV
jgi:dipeptidyl aminopeptidase/acylaminoacyl peptidase